eukprot:8789656-Ditylum_brightwellii.AAC.1
MSRGKKNYHVFHNSCLTYFIKKYDEKRKSMGKDKIPFNTIWTDRCAGQYKCRQNFLQVALSCNTRDTMLLHKFVQKYGFKGSWDATGKLELTKDGTEAETTRLLEYERTGNKKVTDNTPLTTRCTLIGFCTEDRQQFEQLVNKYKQHVIFTNWQRIKDMEAINGTQLFFQVQGSCAACSDGKHNLQIYDLPCSCMNCFSNPEEL